MALSEWRTSDKTKHITLTGKLFPVRASDQSPVLVEMPNSAQFLPIFSREADLRAAMERISIADYTIKQITNGHEFMASLQAGRAAGAMSFRLMVDPRPTDRGTTKWDEIFWIDFESP